MVEGFACEETLIIINEKFVPARASQSRMPRVVKLFNQSVFQSFVSR